MSQYHYRISAFCEVLSSGEGDLGGLWHHVPMSKRPTDHLEPSAKKRTNDRQLTKDDASDDGEDEVRCCASSIGLMAARTPLCAAPSEALCAQVDPGSFQRASEEVLKARRIVKTRRSAAAPASVAASANPFSGVSLGVPSVQSASASNPVHSVSDSVPRKASEEAEQVRRLLVLMHQQV